MWWISTKRSPGSLDHDNQTAMVALADPKSCPGHLGNGMSAPPGFLGGICVALQVVAAFDNATLWHEIVEAVGLNNIIEYATKTEPEEFDLIKLGKYARSEFGRTIYRPRRLPKL